MARLPNDHDLFNRFALRELGKRRAGVLALIEALVQPDDVCLCDRDGAWLWVDGKLTELATRPLVRTLLVALVAEPLTVEQIGELLWPGELMTDDSLRTRVRSSVYQLRKAGLGVEFTDGRYVAHETRIIDLQL